MDHSLGWRVRRALALWWSLATIGFLLFVSFLILRDPGFPLNLGVISTTGGAGLWATLLPGLVGLVAVVLVLWHSTLGARMLGLYSLFWAGIFASALPTVWNAKRTFCMRTLCITTPWISRLLVLALATPFLFVAIGPAVTLVTSGPLGPSSTGFECYGNFATGSQIRRTAGCYPASVMEAKGLTPILNVSDLASTVTWFEKWGWKKLWDWGTPPTFGAVGSGKEACIFLCQGAQGGRGRGANTTTFQQDGDEEGDKGVWMSVWVDDVDEMHKQCVAAGLEVTFPPTDMPWNVREMHLRHPDGHVFRVGRGFEPKK